jgi:hypothetical protein
MSDLHDRIAHALGWTPAEARSLSMHSLRDLVRPVNPDLAREMDYAIQSGAYIRGETHASSDDVTAQLLRDSSTPPGELPLLVAKAKAARDVSKTPSLQATLANFRSSPDHTMGFISKALAYSKAMPSSKREHANLIRLIKGGHVRIYEVRGSSPPGSIARRDSPYGNDRFYELREF